MTKAFKPIKTRRLWPPIHIFFSKACFSLWPPLFTPGVFLVRFHLFFKEIINFLLVTHKNFKIVTLVI